MEEGLDDTNGEGAFATPVSGDECWLVDSGASSHMTCNKKYISSFREFDKSEDVHLGDGRVVQALGVGSIHLKITFKVSRPKPATMNDVLYVPRLACNLFSVRAATRSGNQVKFGHKNCWIRNGSGHLFGVGTLVGKLYQLDCEVKYSVGEHAGSVPERNDLWHERLGDLNYQ